ncbi:hypothetical protein [Treponema phagedenis]|nr:hypothetical protein [Treponema phagedenis]
MKRIISIVAALCCMFGFRFLPALPGMSASAMQVLGIFNRCIDFVAYHFN